MKGIADRRFSRRGVLRRAGVLAGGALVASPLIEASGASAETCSETVQQIVNIAAVAEALAVTTYYRAITADEVFDQVPRGNRPYFRAALSEEYDHLVILQKAGAAATPTTFHYPTGTFESLRGFGKVLEALENAFISAYGAAVPRFCALGQPALAQLAYRIGGVEAEHRFAIRDTLGDTVPNNLCLEPALFDCVSDAAAALAPFVNGASGFTETRRMPTANQITNAIGPFGCS